MHLMQAAMTGLLQYGARSMVPTAEGCVLGWRCLHAMGQSRPLQSVNMDFWSKQACKSAPFTGLFTPEVHIYAL